MAELLTYDPSNDPQAIQIAEERDAETLAVGQAMEDAQNGLLAGKYKSAQDLKKLTLSCNKNSDQMISKPNPSKKIRLNQSLNPIGV